MENKFLIIEKIAATRRRADTPSPASTIIGPEIIGPEIATANHHNSLQTMSTRRATVLISASPAIQQNNPNNVDGSEIATNQPPQTIYEQLMASRRAAALTPASSSALTIQQNNANNVGGPEIAINRRKTPQTIYEQIMASRRGAFLISARQTPAPACCNRKTNWTYNEEEDEEEPFGFKKEFFYNNDDFYTKYR